MTHVFQTTRDVATARKHARSALAMVAIVGTAMVCSIAATPASAQVEPVRHRHHHGSRYIHEGRSADVYARPYAAPYDGWRRPAPIRPGPPGSGLCNTIQIAAGNCPYPSH